MSPIRFGALRKHRARTSIDRVSSQLPTRVSLGMAIYESIRRKRIAHSISGTLSYEGGRIETTND